MESGRGLPSHSERGPRQHESPVLPIVSYVLKRTARKKGNSPLVRLMGSSAPFDRGPPRQATAYADGEGLRQLGQRPLRIVGREDGHVIVVEGFQRGRAGVGGGVHAQVAMPRGDQRIMVCL